MNRTEYLAAASQWKQSYATLSQEIRDNRVAYKKAQQDRNYLQILTTLSKRNAQKSKATEMLAERHAMKEDAANSYVK